MSSAPPVERFSGTDWEECHKFIVAIRARALWEGKQRDSAWKADFAAPLFWRKALLWHSQLPEDVRDDWPKLEIALLQRWPPPEDNDMHEIQPTPAAAPSSIPSEKSDRSLEGVLKVVVNGSNTDYYVKPPAPQVSHLTTDKNEAVRVRCNSLPNATLLERMDHSFHAWLVVEWSVSKPNIGDGSTDHARITCFDSDTLKSTWGGDRPFQLLTCTILANGEVIPVWKKNGTSKLTLVPFVRDKYLFLALDQVAYWRENLDKTRAKLFIEPMD